MHKITFISGKIKILQAFIDDICLDVYVSVVYYGSISTDDSKKGRYDVIKEHFFIMRSD